jgi:exodeoxyribonuclease V beta subunit
MSMTTLDPIVYPFDGVRVIEASAGTGKTWTIEALYLRLLLGHKCTPLRPDRILVVTFTNAATDELRRRIRERLAEAIRHFRGADTKDAFIEALARTYDDGERQAKADDLERAMQWMDEAAIHTIHAWCSQVLRRFPLAGRSLGAMDIQDDDELLLEIVRDYWRANCTDFSPAAHGVSGTLDSPDDLLEGIKRRLRTATPVNIGLEARLEQARTPVIEELRALRGQLAAAARDFEPFLAQARDAGRVKKGKLGAANVKRWLGQVDEWAALDDADDTDVMRLAVRNLSAPALAQCTADGAEPLSHALGDLLQRADEIAGSMDALLTGALYAHAAGWCAPRLAKLKDKRGIVGSDDLVVRVAAALRGTEGTAFAARLRERYPVAMVDEFQDTDATQWSIFGTVYGNADAGSLTLIGDPKQSIYAFRGADLETYLSARATAAGIHQLDTNYRTMEPLVAAVNRVFEQADDYAQGAFLHGDRIPFLPMKAHRTEADAGVNRVPARLVIWRHDEPLSGDALRTTMARTCAQRIVELLEDEGVRPGQIAVLVRSWREAEAVRWAMGLRGVRSVYLSEGDSVYGSPQATEVLRILDACAHPRDDRRVRAAFAMPLLNRSVAELARLGDDEAELEALMRRFLDYHLLWQDRGVLALLYRIAHDFELLASGADARALTNYLHLADLLQNEAASLDGEHAVLRTLQEHIEGGGKTASEEHVVRLESDDDVVRVVTIHKSKGLEYPLVFLPFATAPGRDTDDMAELQRLLYVALTRARHAAWIGVAPSTHYNKPSTHRSLLGYALNGGAMLAPDKLGERLAGLRGDEPAIEIESPPIPDGRTHTPIDPHASGKPARPWQPQPRKPWWIGSYSALALGPRRFEPVESGLEQALRDEDDLPVPPSVDDSIHRIPRGADTGNFLHGLLEWAAEAGFAGAADDDTARRAEILRRCRHRFDAGLWAQTLDRWLVALLSTPLPMTDEPPFPLSALTTYRAELEFHFGARDVSTTRIDDIVSGAVLPGEGRPGVTAGTMNGMLKGYIDLVFEHEGRYWVADFKSNALGNNDAAYTHAAMAAQILKKRYDLQFMLYTLALHRLLRARLGTAYDYDEHVGGAVYLFLRGINEPNGRGVFAMKPPRAAIETLDALFDGKEVGDVA